MDLLDFYVSDLLVVCVFFAGQPDGTIRFNNIGSAGILFALPEQS